MAQKKIKGSAYLTPDGGFTFTPYNSVGESEKNLKMVVNSRFSSLWASKKTISVRMSFTRKNIPPFSVWIEELTNLYNSLNKNLNDI